MAITLTATVGGASSNTLATLAEAETYMAERLHGDAWTTATSEQKKAALVWAGKLMNTLQWWGSTVDQVTPQAMAWPRDDVYDRDGNEIAGTIIPNDIKYGQIEWAFALVQEDLQKESDTTGIWETEVDVIKVKFDRYKRQKDTIPLSAMQYFSGYLSGTAFGSSGSVKRLKLVRD